jgi:hypothetical protein
MLTLLSIGVQGGTPDPVPQPDAIIAKSKTYQVSGTIPAKFEPRANAKGKAVFFEPKDFVAISQMEVQTDANGVFNVSLPASSSKQTALRVEIRFPSESYVPLEGNCRVTPDKPAAIVFVKPLNKRNAVHYFGVFLDEISNEPVPYVGIYADSRFAWRKSFRTSKSISFHNSANCGNAILIVWFPCEIRNSSL